MRPSGGNVERAFFSKKMNQTQVEFLDYAGPASTFGWVDYGVFGVMLSLSSAIGLYFGCVGEQSTEEYLLGGRNMKTIPIAISLVAR